MLLDPRSPPPPPARPLRKIAAVYGRSLAAPSRAKRRIEASGGGGSWIIVEREWEAYLARARTKPSANAKKPGAGSPAGLQRQ